MDNESGAIVILTAIMLTMLLGFAALSIDTGNLMVTKNELHNAADAGALAGANALFAPGGTAIEIGCNQIAYDTAIANLSVKSPVEVNWVPGDNDGSDVERGHWSFTTREFTPNASLILTDLWGASEADLDINTDYINAVRVTVRRQETPTPSFFARIFGHDDFKQIATAVAYIGFAGTFVPGEIDFPIGLCEDVIYPPGGDGNPVCSETVFYEKEETAMWVNLIQPDQTPEDDACNTNANELKGIVVPVLQHGNPHTLIVGEGMGATNGTDTSVLSTLIPEWENISKATTNSPGDSRKVLRRALPVIDCITSNTCTPLRGAVNVDILWIIQQKITNSAEEALAPYDYYDADILNDDGSFKEQGPLLFHSDLTNNHDRMQAFIASFPGGLPTQDEMGHEKDKRVFFRLDCETAPPLGGPGGINSGVHAERAVLVK